MLKKAADKKNNITQIYALCHMYWFPIMTKGILGFCFWKIIHSYKVKKIVWRNLTLTYRNTLFVWNEHIMHSVHEFKERDQVQSHKDKENRI